MMQAQTNQEVQLSWAYVSVKEEGDDLWPLASLFDQWISCFKPTSWVYGIVYVSVMTNGFVSD